VRGFTGEGGSHRRAWLGAEERGCKSGELLGTSVRLATPVETKSRVGRRRGGLPRRDAGTLGRLSRVPVGDEWKLRGRELSSVGRKRCERK